MPPGRPPLPAHERLPRVSGEHSPVLGDDLRQQRQTMARAVCGRLDARDPLHRHFSAPEAIGEPLPYGSAPRVATLLGLPERSGGEGVRQMWAGKRRYYPRAVIF